MQNTGDMKKLLFLLLLSSCMPVKYAGTKPYIITEKYRIAGERNSAEYRYIDSLGNRYVTYDEFYLFNVGDTVK